MKKILSLLVTTTLIGTSTTNLVACNNKHKIHEYTKEKLTKLKGENNINTKDGILEWIVPQEKSFNKVDNKYYFLVWRNNKNGHWNINKFNNDKENILITGDTQVEKWHHDLIIRVPEISNIHHWKDDNGTYFKSVYRWNLTKQEPILVIDNDGKVGVK